MSRRQRSILTELAILGLLGGPARFRVCCFICNRAFGPGEGVREIEGGYRVHPACWDPDKHTRKEELTNAGSAPIG